MTIDILSVFYQFEKHTRLTKTVKVIQNFFGTGGRLQALPSVNSKHALAAAAVAGNDDEDDYVAADDDNVGNDSQDDDWDNFNYHIIMIKPFRAGPWKESTSSKVFLSTDI
ncbi:hypothetical protein PoB_004637100 [Plakobranchus ocellatus]|uniref:Uncharacterized protein n=1 Tax=Plakobranchus ocellatus TaxID=259542 RepID=A0AAV4BHE3_9GAST|nr:hypothetical protein PoB_004637100 [Plakobranchus ocellatus]